MNKVPKMRLAKAGRCNDFPIGHIFAILAIIIVGICFIVNESSIKIVGDEFGYWSSAAWMAGYDWADVASINSYYGYGYGFLLLPILKLGIGQIYKYQAALVINIVLLAATYMISYTFLNKYKSALSETIKILVSLISVFYVSNIYYVQYTLVEVLLCFLYWCTILLLYELLHNFTMAKMLLLELLLAYTFCVHQRTIGNVLIGIVFLGYILVRRKENRTRNLLISIAFLALLCFLVFYIKNSYQLGYLSNNLYIEKNDFSGQLQNVKAVFTLDGLKLFFMGVLGKIYYACSASYLLFIVFIIRYIKKLTNFFKNKSQRKQGELFIDNFLLLNVFAAICVSSIFLLDYTKRFDAMIYGRYFEFTLIPVIVIAVTEWMEDVESDLSACWWMILFYECLTFVIHFNIPYDESRSHVFMNLSAFGDLLNGDHTLLLVNLKVLVIFCAILFLLKKNKELKKKKKKSVKYLVGLISILMINWMITAGIVSLEMHVWTSSMCGSEEALADQIFQMHIEDDLYYYADQNRINIDFLQFLLGDHKIHCVSEANEALNLPSGAYLLTENTSDYLFTETLQQTYEDIGTSFCLKLWKKIEGAG